MMRKRQFKKKIMTIKKTNKEEETKTCPRDSLKYEKCVFFTRMSVQKYAHKYHKLGSTGPSVHCKCVLKPKAA